MSWEREMVDLLHEPAERLPTALPMIRVSQGPNLTPGPEPSGEPLPPEFDPRYYSRLELGPYKPPVPPERAPGGEHDQDDWRGR